MPYSQTKSLMEVSRAKIGGQEPFLGVEINMDEVYRMLSSQCLSRDPEKRPVIFEITTILSPAFVASAYDKAIELYTAAIDLDPATATTFANRCKVKMEKMLWEQALDDAQKVLHYPSARSPG